MDFSFKLVRVDDDTRTVIGVAVPDPRRYEEVTVKGKTYFRDKFLDYLVSIDDFARQMTGLPMYHIEPSIESATTYAASRKPALKRELETGEYSAPNEKAKAHQPLEANANTREVSFVSVDICGSTALRKSDANGFERGYKMFMQELGTIVGQFNGALLKATGDGFIACIDHPSFTSLCDATIDMGLTFLVVLRDSINPTLKEAGLKPLRIRVGADYEEAQFTSIAIPTTGFSTPDVRSDALNRAVKIQEACEPDEFRIGRTLYELIHVQWLERAEETSFDGQSVGIPGYRTYRVR